MSLYTCPIEFICPIFYVPQNYNIKGISFVQLIYVFLKLDVMMTTVTGTSTVPQRGKTEDDSALYESPSAHIIEETEYVKKVCGC